MSDGHEPEEKGGPAEIRDRNKRVRAEAAERRAQRRRELEAAQSVGLDATERVDDLFTRAVDSTWKWLKHRFRTLLWGAVGLLVALTVWWYVDAHSDVRGQLASDDLSKAVVAEQATLGNPADDRRVTDGGFILPGRIVETDALRLEGALAAFKKAEAEAATPALATLARLGVAGVYFEQRKFSEARAEYEAVSKSPLAEVDEDVRGRALEGAGLSAEDAGELPAALATFEALGALEAPRFKQLALLDRARVLALQGKTEESKTLLTELRTLLGPPTLGGDAGYVAEASRLVLAEVDPTATGGAIDPAALQDLIRQLQAAQAKEAPAPAPPAPPEAPVAPTPGAGGGANP